MYKNINKDFFPKKLTVTAHSGCMNTPSNSVESIQKGFESGADMIEIDIRFASDGTPVLSHSVTEKSEKDVVKLAEAFDFIKNYPGKKANLDIKETSNLKRIAALAREKGVEGQIFFTGVWPRFVRRVKKDCPEIPHYLNYNCIAFLSEFTPYIKYLISRTKKAGAVGINMNKNGCSAKLIMKFHEADLLVSVWTIRRVDDAKKYLAMKPDNITCVNPDEVIELIKG